MPLLGCVCVCVCSCVCSVTFRSTLGKTNNVLQQLNCLCATDELGGQTKLWRYVKILPFALTTFLLIAFYFHHFIQYAVKPGLDFVLAMTRQALKYVCSPAADSVIIVAYLINAVCINKTERVLRLHQQHQQLSNCMQLGYWLLITDSNFSFQYFFTLVYCHLYPT